jgi:hypothetical protein
MAWMAEESLPTASWQLAAAVCQAPASESGEWVYAIGGNGEGGVLAAVAGYDTVQQRWFARPSMPTPPLRACRSDQPWSGACPGWF